jgi:hypothetical protein
MKGKCLHYIVLQGMEMNGKVGRNSDLIEVLSLLPQRTEAIFAARNRNKGLQIKNLEIYRCAHARVTYVFCDLLGSAKETDIFTFKLIKKLSGFLAGLCRKSVQKTSKVRESEKYLIP